MRIVFWETVNSDRLSKGVAPSFWGMRPIRMSHGKKGKNYDNTGGKSGKACKA